MANSDHRNIPLDQLGDEALIDLVANFGIFSYHIQSADASCAKFPLQQVLLCSLKLYDMNLLRIVKRGKKCYVNCSDLPSSVVTHLIESDSDQTFLPAKVRTLVDKFVETVEEDNLFGEDNVGNE